MKRIDGTSLPEILKIASPKAYDLGFDHPSSDSVVKDGVRKLFSKIQSKFLIGLSKKLYGCLISLI